MVNRHGTFFLRRDLDLQGEVLIGLDEDSPTRPVLSLGEGNIAIEFEPEQQQNGIADVRQANILHRPTRGTDEMRSGE
jgi:hypothetical protein